METFSINTALLSTMSLSITFALFGMARTTSAQTMEQFENDTREFITIKNDIFNRWELANFGHGKKIDDYIELLNQAQSINDITVVPAEKALADYKQKYGKYGLDKKSIQKLHEELARNEKKGISNYPVYSAYDQLINEIKNFKEGIIAKGDVIATEADTYFLSLIESRETPKEVTDFIREARTVLSITLTFNPNSTQAKELLKKLEVISKEKTKLIEESRKSARMPAQHPDFTDFDGDAADVVKQALAYLNSKSQDGKQKYFTGSIASDWYVRRNSFTDVIDNTIQINIGYQTKGEPANLVHVYQAILYTCGSQASPPFCKSGSVPGWEFDMLKENLGK
jgi:hypothetical protein